MGRKLRKMSSIEDNKINKTSVRRSVHHSLPQYLSYEMERMQKRALRIILPDLSFAEDLVALDIT